MKARQGRVVVDATKCDGHGICVLRCPQALSLDAWGYVGVESTEPLTGAVLRRAQSAAAACPEGALAVVEVRDAKAPTGPDVVPTESPDRADSFTWRVTGTPTRP